MPSSGYVANVFIAGEQPSTVKWNQLWGNDASFNSGNGFNDQIILWRHLAATLFGGQLSSYTNGAPIGGTFYYLNLLGIKVVFGTTGTSGSIGAGGASNFAINFPTSFFTALESVDLTINVISGPTTATAIIFQSMGAAANSVPGWINNSGGSAGTYQVSAVCLGT